MTDEDTFQTSPVAFAFSLSSLAARADVVYDYTGADFTSVTGPYTTSDSVTGSFTVASPLEDNLNLLIITPVSFSFSDGQQTLTNANAASEFHISTDAAGDVTGWIISIELNHGGGAAILSTSGAGYGSQDEGESPTSSGFSYTAGSFTEVPATPSPVPEPQSWALMLTGLALLLALRFGTRSHPHKLA
jgi:hypothetical protein